MPNHGGVLKEALLPSKMGTNNGSNSKLLESRPSSKTRLLHHSELERKTTTLEAAMAAVAATKTGQLPILKKTALKIKGYNSKNLQSGNSCCQMVQNSNFLTLEGHIFQ